MFRILHEIAVLNGNKHRKGGRPISFHRLIPAYYHLHRHYIHIVGVKDNKVDQLLKYIRKKLNISGVCALPGPKLLI